MDIYFPGVLCDYHTKIKEKIWNNYLNEVKRNIDIDNAVVLFDDSDINKEYSKKLEDLDRVIDASDPNKRIVNGYHVCEATILSKNEKQPMSIYSQIYSCKSDSFKSKNIYTLESIKAAEELVGENFTGVFDRGYDDNKIFEYMSKNNHKFVVRLDNERTLLLKGKKRNVKEVASTRKGKIKMTALFDDNEEKEDLITRLADGDSSVIEDLTNSMLLHVAEMAQDYRDKGVSFGDLIQEGNVALTEVISDYDGDPDIESFNEMVDEAVTEAFESAAKEQAESDKISQRLADKLNLLDDTTKRLTEKLGRVPEESELAKEMDIPEEEVDNLLKISLDVLSVNEDSHLADDIDSSIDDMEEEISDDDPLDWRINN